LHAELRKKKILHVITTLNVGGAETNLLNLVSALKNDNVETHVGYSYGGELEQNFVDSGVKLYKYANRLHRVASIYTFVIIARIARYIRRHGIDVVQTHSVSAQVWGSVAAKLAGAKVVEHVHDGRYTCPAELARRYGSSRQFAFIRCFSGLSDRIIVLTQHSLEYAIRHSYAKPQSIIKMQNGIPLTLGLAQDRALIRASLDLAPDAVVMLTIARIDPTKNIDLILRIAHKVVAQAPQTVFVVAGTGPYLSEYAKRCTELNLHDHVRFIGFRKDIRELLAASDVFLLPSFLELHSIAILEALNAKVPVVVSDVGCTAEFIQDGHNGFLCDPFEDDPWIRALVRLARDARFRAECGNRGHDTCCSLFDIKSTAVRMKSLYDELLHC
jgi:glycosyltransferase involved in cell wall biosynthesis